MTRIEMKTENTLTKIKVNGRLVEFANRIESIENVSAGRWEGIACGESFEIIGGKASGGAPNEWLLKFPLGYGDQHIPAKSAAQCIRLIEMV